MRATKNHFCQLRNIESLLELDMQYVTIPSPEVSLGSYGGRGLLRTAPVDIIREKGAGGGQKEKYEILFIFYGGGGLM